MGSLDDMLSGRPSRGNLSRVPVTATVTRSDDSGVHVVPFEGDTRHPIGPCRGAIRGYGNQAAQLPRGTVVLVVFTDAGPWIAGWDAS